MVFFVLNNALCDRADSRVVETEGVSNRLKRVLGRKGPSFLSALPPCVIAGPDGLVRWIWLRRQAVVGCDVGARVSASRP